MAYKISKEDMIKPSSSAIELTDGIYYTTIVGYMIHRKEPYTEDKDPFDAVRFALQLIDDAGHSKILQTVDWRISLAEKSKLFVQLAGWVKASSPNDLWERLEKANFMDADGSLNFDKFLGTHPAIMVKMVPSKKDASKTYPDITLAATKKGQEHQIDTGDFAEGGQAVPLWIGDFISPENIIETSCLKGFEWKRYEKKDDEEKEKDAPKTRVQRIAQKPMDQVKSKIADEPDEHEEPVDAQKNEVPAPAQGQASQHLVIRKRNKPQASAANNNAAIGAFTGEPMDDKDSDLPF